MKLVINLKHFSRELFAVQYTRYVFFRFFLYFFGLFRNRCVCFGCFETDPKHRNKPKKCFISFAKQTEKQPKQIEFRFVSVRTENFFCLFRGHPNDGYMQNLYVHS
jgi:hypothetical protein